MAIPEIRLENLKEPMVRDAFYSVLEASRSEDITNCNFRFFTITVTGSNANLKYPHGFLFVPKDIIITSQIGPGVLEFNYALFDNTNFDISTTDSVTVRFFAGSFIER